LTAWWRSSACCQKYKQTHQRNNEFFCHCAEDLIMLSQIDSSIFDNMVEIFCMLPKIYSHKAHLHYVADLTPKKRSLWARSCRPADCNMSVGRPAGSSSKAPLQTPSQKIHHLCYWLFFVCFMLCTFFFKPFSMKTLKIQGLMSFRFYNLDTLHAFRNIKSELPQFLIDGGVSPKVWPVSGAIIAFLDG